MWRVPNYHDFLLHQFWARFTWCTAKVVRQLRHVCNAGQFKCWGGRVVLFCTYVTRIDYFHAMRRVQSWFCMKINRIKRRQHSSDLLVSKAKYALYAGGRVLFQSTNHNTLCTTKLWRVTVDFIFDLNLVPLKKRSMKSTFVPIVKRQPHTDRSFHTHTDDMW